MHTLKINTLSKKELDNLKKVEGYPSFSSAVLDMCTFFKVNRISPKDGTVSTYQNSLFNIQRLVKNSFSDFNKKFDKDSQSMRKLMRAIEKDHMVSLGTKVEYVYSKMRDEEVSKNIEDKFNAMIPESKELLDKQEEINLLEEKIEQQKKEISDLKYRSNDDEKLYLRSQESLKKIYQKYNLEKNTFGGKEKIVIDMDKEAFEELFNINF